ncbi:hypothetical protein K492DRAFT_83625 [Lichtheimia hyalospora FSU 10163]|nr:hypothetical protein K492DRAFT_83625 [Lichtheimia hyalospora FSU 10163]
MTTTPTTPRGGSSVNTVHIQRPKAPLQETVSRSLTTPILASNSTPVSIADRFQRRTTPTPPSPPQQQPFVTTTSPSLPPSRATPSSSLMTRSRTLHTVNAILTTASDGESETDEEDMDTNESANSTNEDDDEDDPVINEARVNRKIADLEISNRSLLAVNELLEITVRRQASQVAKLKKQLAHEGPIDIKPLPLPSSGTTTEVSALYSTCRRGDFPHANL